MGKYSRIFRRKEDGDYRIERSFVRTVIVSGVLFLLFLCLKTDNIFRWAQAAITVRRQEKELLRGEEQIRKMDQYILSITTDKDSLEKLAREKFHFIRPGDDLYIISE